MSNPDAENVNNQAPQFYEPTSTQYIQLGTLWTMLGPLQPGWNAAANNGQGSGGSNTALAASGVSSASSGSQPSSASANGQSSPFAPPFIAQLQGTLTQSGPDSNGNVTLVVNTTLSQGASGALQITL